jgi:hypothetical protein
MGVCAQKHWYTDSHIDLSSSYQRDGNCQGNSWTGAGCQKGAMIYGHTLHTVNFTRSLSSEWSPSCSRLACCFVRLLQELVSAPPGLYHGSPLHAFPRLSRDCLHRVLRFPVLSPLCSSLTPCVPAPALLSLVRRRYRGWRVDHRSPRCLSALQLSSEYGSGSAGSRPTAN